MAQRWRLVARLEDNKVVRDMSSLLAWGAQLSQMVRAYPRYREIMPQFKAEMQAVLREFYLLWPRWHRVALRQGQNRRAVKELKRIMDDLAFKLLPRAWQN